jgi:hypothetical protein
VTQALADLKARLALLREMGVAAYSRDGDKETVQFFPPSTSLAPSSIVDRVERRTDEEARQSQWEHDIARKAAGGIRPVVAADPSATEKAQHAVVAEVRRERARQRAGG